MIAIWLLTGQTSCTTAPSNSDMYLFAVPAAFARPIAQPPPASLENVPALLASARLPRRRGSIRLPSFRHLRPGLCRRSLDLPRHSGNPRSCAPDGWVTLEALIWATKNSPLPVPLITTGSPFHALPCALGQPGTQVIYGGDSINLHAAGGFRLKVDIGSIKTRPLASMRASSCSVGSSRARRRFPTRSETR